MVNKSEELEEQLLISRQTSQEKEEEVSQQLLPCNDCECACVSGLFIWSLSFPGKRITPSN